MTAPASAVEPLLLDESQGAALCGVSLRTFQEFVAAGWIPVVAFPCPLNPRRTLRRKLVDRRDVERFIDAHKRGGDAGLRLVGGPRAGGAR